MNLLQPMHILLILVVALLLFGNRLPEVARSLGRALNEFKRGLKDVADDARADPPAGAQRPTARQELTPPQNTDAAVDKQHTPEKEEAIR